MLWAATGAEDEQAFGAKVDGSFEVPLPVSPGEAKVDVAPRQPIVAAQQYGMGAARVQVLVTGRRIGHDGPGAVVPGGDPECVGGGDDARLEPFGEVWCRLDGDGVPRRTAVAGDDHEQLGRRAVGPADRHQLVPQTGGRFDRPPIDLVDGHLGHRPRGAAVR